MTGNPMNLLSKTKPKTLTGSLFLSGFSGLKVRSGRRRPVFLTPGKVAGVLVLIMGLVLGLAVTGPARADVPGPAYAWGANYAGQLGDGTTDEKDTPVAVTLPAGVFGFSNISAGGFHNLGTSNDGKLYAWGTNANGQLGDGTTTNRTSPVAVTLPAGVTAFTSFSAGSYQNLAKGNDGKLYAWGNNASGQLGDGTTTERHTPVPVTLPFGVTSFSSFAAGNGFSLAKGDDGKLYGWGFNGNGQLGNGNTTNQNIPAAIILPSGVSSFTTFSAGTGFALGMADNGNLYAWGNNATGQFGDGTTTSSNTPVAVALPAGITGFSAFVAGGDHSLAKGSDGKLYAWGNNIFGELGDGTTTEKHSPVLVTLPVGVTGFTKFAAGYFHTLAIGSDGKLYAWGTNDTGNLGDGTTDEKDTPVAVVGVSGLTGISAGYQHSVAWGSNGNNVVVNKTTDDGSAGTLRNALLLAQSGDTISFSLPFGTHINMVGSGLTVPAGVTIQGSCDTTGPGVILDFSNISDTALTLLGRDKLDGLEIHRGTGQGLVAPAGNTSNKLNCLRIS